MLQRRRRPAETAGHRRPHVVARAQLDLRADEREEHAEFGAVHLLKEPAEHVVVVEEVAPALVLVAVERLLQLDEELGEAFEHDGAGARRRDARAPLDDLQPLLDVDLQP